MAALHGTLLLTDEDEIKATVGTGLVHVRIGDILLQFKPEHLAILEKLESATAVALMDLEAIAANAEASLDSLVVEDNTTALSAHLAEQKALRDERLHCEALRAQERRPA